MFQIINIRDNGIEQRPMFSNLKGDWKHGKLYCNLCNSTKTYL